MKLIIKILLAGLVVVLFFACSEINNNIETAPQISVHKKGILDETSPDFHGNLLRTLNWNISACWQCHASDYTGGITGASCLKCHTEADGPEACNTCHGDPNNPDRIAPPEDLNGNTSTSSRGVGAHESHVYDNQLTENFRCSNCHKFPSGGFSDPTHIDGDNRAEIIFGRIAVTGEGINSSYDLGSGNCSNTYCHGNFVFYRDSSAYSWAYEDSIIIGNNVTVNWTSVGQSQAECGSCHGLPPTGHISTITINQCGYCHKGIVDESGNLVDSLKYKHINGEIDFELPPAL